jgi:two-component system, cell cycle response regulator
MISLLRRGATWLFDLLTFVHMPIRRKFTLFSLGVSLWFFVLGGIGAWHADTVGDLAAIGGALALAHLLLFLFAVSITRSLKGPLDSIIEQIRALTRGDITGSGRIVVGSGDEVGELSARFNRLLDALRDINVFKRVIEEDDSTGDVYERLSEVFTRYGLEDHCVYETRLDLPGVHPAVGGGQEEPWCDAAIGEDRNLCRAMRTAEEVSSATFPNICKQFALKDRAHTCLPLIVGGAPEGVILFVHDGTEPAAHESTKLQLETAGRFIKEALPVIEGKKLAETLRETALRDTLTGLHNRRFIQETRRSLVAGALRRDSRIGLLMCDLDHFKAVNDEHGHDAGDAVLKELSQVIAGGLRSADTLVRWGGEEFLAVLMDPEPGTSMQVAERIREAVAGHTFQHNGVSIRKTVSVGVAELPADGMTMEAAIGAADVALYQAKDGGRNRAVRFVSERAADTVRSTPVENGAAAP